MSRVILHIDFDSFFASCEQQFHPELRGKPLGITATHGRTAIIAASREAKKAGVTSPGRTFEAQKLCPDLLLSPAHFDQYWEISKKFISICKDYSPLTEVFSLDEVFMDITHTRFLYGGTTQLIKQLKKRLQKQIGEYITVSIGVSFNKMLAKLASGLRKPNGLVVIGPHDIQNIYASAQLTDICGIGNRIKFRLNSIGIYTLVDLRKASLVKLIHEFGNVEGHFLKQVGEAQDDSPVIPYTEDVPVKSVGRNYCLPKNEYNQTIILQNIYELCEEIGIKLRRLNMRARTVGLGLRGTRSEFGNITRGFSTYAGKEIFESCKTLYEKWEWDKEKLNTGSIYPDTRAEYDRSTCAEHSRSMVRQISVWTGNLEKNTATPLSLFTNTLKQEKVIKAIDQVNNRFGHHTIRNAFLLYADKLTTKPNGFMADRYERKILSQEF